MLTRIVLIGAGNVASALARVLKIEQCYARKEADAKAMAQIASSSYAYTLDTIIKDADLYIISISDDAISPFCKELVERVSPNAIIAHTSGTMHLNELCAERRAVFYPLQKFVKGTEVDFSEIPILIEGVSKEVEHQMADIAHKLSNRVEFINSERRCKLHIAAVLTCNFTNHLYALAWRFLKDNNLPFDLIKPLIKESVEEVLQHDGDIAELQTGPAARKDMKTINTHIEILNNDENLKQIYILLSNSIINGKL